MTAALLGFALATTLLILAPGPDSLLVMRNTMRSGGRAGWATAAGTLSGLLVWAMGATLGLSALLQASRLGYDVLRFAGAAYLIWLGVSSLGLFHRRTTHSHHQAEPAEPTTPVARFGRVYLNGLVSNVFNPKIGVFFIAFLPGFIPAGESTAMFSFAPGCGSSWKPAFGSPPWCGWSPAASAGCAASPCSDGSNVPLEPSLSVSVFAWPPKPDNRLAALTSATYSCTCRPTSTGRKPCGTPATRCAGWSPG